MSHEPPVRVLLVEDDAGDAEIFRRRAAACQGHSIQVDHVTTSEQALRRLSTREYDLTFLDQHLGGAVTGLDILKRIRAAGLEPPAIVLTGAGREDVAVEMMKNGAMDYLAKNNFDSEILGRSIRYALEQHRSAMARRRAEEALRESERKYRYLFENLSDAAFLADAETGRILDANKRAEALLGRTRREILGMHQTELHPPSKGAHYRRIFARHVQQDHVAHDDGEVTRKDGATVPVGMSAATFTNADQHLILRLFHDMTERNRLETAQREAEKLRAIRGLAAGVAHNFNNLLTGVLGFAQLARAALNERGAPTDDIDLAIRCARDAARLSKQLEEWTRPIVRSQQTIVLDSLVADLVERCRESLPGNIKLAVHVASPTAPLKASFDSVLGALLNICDNAREAMPDGGVLTITAETVRRRTQETEREFAAISISDTGVGIEPAVLPKIFEPFFSTKRTVGVGLGLPLSRHIAEEHGGSVEVHSAPGQGATVKVFLPIAQEHGGSRERAPATAGAHQPRDCVR